MCISKVRGCTWHMAPPRLRSIRQDLTIQMVQDIFVVEADLRKVMWSWIRFGSLRYIRIYICIVFFNWNGFLPENPLKLINGDPNVSLVRTCTNSYFVWSFFSCFARYLLTRKSMDEFLGPLASPLRCTNIGPKWLWSLVTSSNLIRQQPNWRPRWEPFFCKSMCPYTKILQLRLSRFHWSLLKSRWSPKKKSDIHVCINHVIYSYHLYIYKMWCRWVGKTWDHPLVWKKQQIEHRHSITFIVSLS